MFTCAKILINDILQIRLKYCMSYVILRSAHSKRTWPQYNALNKIYFKTPSMHILECCFARSLQARSLRSNKKKNPWLYSFKWRPVGKLSMLSESVGWSIGKRDTAIGKSATKAIVMSEIYFFSQKRYRRGGGGWSDRFKMLWFENFFWSHLGFCRPPWPKILATPLTIDNKIKQSKSISLFKKTYSQSLLISQTQVSINQQFLLMWRLNYLSNYLIWNTWFVLIWNSN